MTGRSCASFDAFDPIGAIAVLKRYEERPIARSSAKASAPQSGAKAPAWLNDIQARQRHRWKRRLPSITQ
jgi:hypothetical protein